MAAGIHDVDPAAEVVEVPIADGGEGTALGRVSLNRDRAPPYSVHGHHRPLPAAHR
ncbi:glycerate kinase [Corynebacterium variabile]|uniref:glycerate kinase n=1 Tax=Corynebacterium variabile TaxID=1727 RepID=UPI003BB6ABD5